VTHHNAFKSQVANDLLSIAVNCAIGVPYSMMFKIYHAEHHKYQGWDGIDTDIPSDIELRLLQTFPGKVFFATFQILFYAFRPCLLRAQTLTWKHGLNWAAVVVFDAVWVALFGTEALIFLLGSTMMAGSWNPVSGHFISEHYVFDKKGVQETYSYYGPWNAISFNVGYHNEHHDFPALPWTALPKLRALAPEFYETLQVTESWLGAAMNFVLDDNVGVWARVKREEGAGKRKVLLPTTKDAVSVDFADISKQGGCLASI
jgi:sphingolipid delta-4 desaturase